MSSPDTETLAENFAAQGREELVTRFRDAYAQALGTHSDLVSFDSERVETMVQHSAADADGLQWRRALAGVAARELNIDLGSALTHPAVVRAHQLVAAPTYESALAAFAVPAPLPEPPAAPALLAKPPTAPEPVKAEAAEAAEPVEAAKPAAGEIEAVAEAALAVVVPEASPESDPEPEPVAADQLALADQPTMTYAAVDAPGPSDEDVEAEEEEPSDDVLADRAADFADEFMAGEPAATAPTAPPDDDLTFEQAALELPAVDPDEAEFSAVHLGGVASLPASEEISLRLSEDGLDLLQDDGTIVGRLSWTDIAALEVTVPHSRRRRRNAPRLVVHTSGGSARFEVPGLSGEELQDQVQPLMARFGQ